MNRIFPSVAVALLAFAFGQGLAQAAPSDIVVSEDFESTPVGAIPQGFIKTGQIGVEEGVAHSGTHALKIEPAVKGGRFITLAPDKVAALGGEHWGRLYYKVGTPAPSPAPQEGKKTPIIHATFVAAKATSPLENDPIELRLAGLILNAAGDYRYLYNVQPRKRKEFGVHAKAAHQFNDEWTLIEWHVDYASQTYQFFVNGEEVTDLALHKGAGQFEGAEIPPALQTLSIGWTNYQPASGAGFTVWIDDLAIGKTRLGPVLAAK